MAILQSACRNILILLLDCNRIPTCKNISAFALLALDPMQTTISPYVCIMPSISRVASAEQSVNNETSSGTLSTFSRCGWMFSMPRGSLACQEKLLYDPRWYENNNRFVYASKFKVLYFGQKSKSKLFSLVLLTRLDMSKFMGALCSVLSVRQLNERQFSSSIAESLDARCCILMDTKNQNISKQSVQVCIPQWWSCRWAQPHLDLFATDGHPDSK